VKRNNNRIKKKKKRRTNGMKTSAEFSSTASESKPNLHFSGNLLLPRGGCGGCKAEAEDNGFL
jgi:hypothetical protein